MQITSRLSKVGTPRILTALRQTLAPVAAAIYLLLWIFGELGRDHLAGNIETFALFGVAVGLSVWMPRTAMALVLVAECLQVAGLLRPPQDTTWPAWAALAYVVFFVGLFARGLTRWLALPVIAVGSALFGWLTAIPTQVSPDRWGSWVGNPGQPRQDAALLALAAFGVGVLAWILGALIDWIVSRIHGDFAAMGTRLERVDVELRLAEDRARISRDVHDSLAHSLAVIVSQSQGGLALSATKPEVAGEALATVTDVARTALVDVRGLVERIQGDQAATDTPLTLDDVPGLIDTMRGVGMSVDLVVTGDETSLTSAQEMAVYRIVQESLTNALKHAGSDATVSVGLDHGATGLGIEVASRVAPGSSAPAPTASPGVGIAGMRERARLAGGWLRAAASGRVDDSGDARFVVTAFVPATSFGVRDA